MTNRDFPAALYRHGNLRTALISASAATGLHDLAELRRRAPAKQPGRAECVYAMMRIYIQFAQDHKGLFGLMADSGLPAGSAYPELIEACHDSFELFSSAVCDYARDNEWLEDDMPLVIRAAWSVGQGLAALVAGGRIGIEGDGTDLERAIDFSVSLLFGAVAAGPEHTRLLLLKYASEHR